MVACARGALRERGCLSACMREEQHQTASHYTECLRMGLINGEALACFYRFFRGLRVGHATVRSLILISIPSLSVVLSFRYGYRMRAVKIWWTPCAKSSSYASIPRRLVVR